MRAAAGSVLLAVCLSWAVAAAAADAASRLHAGPMPGYVGMRAARIWVQAEAPAQAEMVYWPQDQPEARRRTAAIALDAAGDHIGIFEITDLEPGHGYAYELLLDGAREPLAGLQFHTQPLWQWRGDPPVFEVALGSCAYINEAAYDRPGAPYGGHYEIFAAIAARRPAFMLWLGDNIYLREPDLHSPDGIAYRYRHARGTPELQALLRGTHHLAIWDDHDYGPNNANRSFVWKAEALAQFRRYWANPSYGLPEAPGTFTQFRYADADFFLLDDRYYRDADRGHAWPGKQLYGAVQINWLKNALAASTATFKLIVGGSESLNDRSTGEGWHRFPDERGPFLRWLGDNKLSGVVFLSGDRHFTRLARMARDGAYPLHELSCSPLTSGAAGNMKPEHLAGYVEGTLVTRRNFCTLAFSGPRRQRVLAVSSYDTAGQVLWTHAIREADLRRTAAP